MLPQHVIREAIVNAIMHRDYQVHSPVLVVRYSNRIEIQNAGYSLKPETDLGQMGSKLRNPVIASVLYDIHFAETKGSGIGTMRQLLHDAGLSPPVFHSSSIKNQFNAIYLLHQLLDDGQLIWLQQFSDLSLSDDEAKALIFAKETGAVDNAGLRAITGLDTLASSKLLGKLHHQHSLLTQYGAGSTTYYQLKVIEELPLIRNIDSGFKGDLSGFKGDLKIPQQLAALLAELNSRSRKEKLWPAILWLCSFHALNTEQLAAVLNRQTKALKSNYLNPLRTQEKLLEYIYPEVPNHPEQAYKTTPEGLDWLRNKGINTEINNGSDKF